MLHCMACDKEFLSHSDKLEKNQCMNCGMRKAIPVEKARKTKQHWKRC